MTAGLYEVSYFIFGGILLAVMLFFPAGAVGAVDRFWKLVRRAGPARADASVSGSHTLPKHVAMRVAAKGSPVLELDRVTKSYAGVVAVKDVSCCVRGGTIHALIGPNGAGKSTLINVISGLYAEIPDQSAYLGKDIAGQSADQRANLGIARTFQNLQLIGTLTILENVMLGIPRSHRFLSGFATWLFTDREVAKARAEAMQFLEFFGIARLANALPGDLAYGHRKLCELARALAQRPTLMLLDEPIAGLNEEEVREVTAAIRTLARSRRHRAPGRAQHDVRHGPERDGYGARLRTENRRRPARQRSAKPGGHHRLSRNGGGVMIEARGLVVGIGSNEILHGVDVSVPKGQITAVVGANGAGKTTLLRTLSRLLPLRRGSIMFDNRSIDDVEPHKIAQRGLVHVPQGRMIIPGLTVEENLRIGANRVPDLKPPEIEQMLECEYERFPVLKSRRMVLGTSLSGGEQQMLAVSRALMMKPKLIMLDEPSLGLAPQIVSVIFRALRGLAASGTTVLLVEQAAIAALRLADVGYVLQNGAVVLSGSSASLLDNPQLIERYLG